jgi:transcriptional regulator with XRE-family HTH domain
MKITTQLAEVKDRIKKLRELKGFTQTQLAQKLNMTVRNYQNLENGDKDISFSELQIIADALEMSIASLVSFDTKMVFNNCKVDGNSANYINSIVNGAEKLYEKLLIEKDNYINDLQKQIQKNEDKHDKQIQSLEKQLDALHILLNK